MTLSRHNLVEVADRQAGLSAALALLKSLANPDRLSILCSVIENEKSVSELEVALEIRQPTLSQQLARLRSDALVDTRRHGKIVYYSIGSKDAERIIEVLHDLYCS